MNCPSCGAVIKEGKFCNYCGAKLPDDVKRSEVVVRKYIEDAAEIKRADYESEESKLRRMEMLREFKARKVKCISLIVLFILSVLLFFVSAIFYKQAWSVGTGIVSIPAAIYFLVRIIKDLVTGKW